MRSSRLSDARTPVWLWLNLLSLDAPLVALVWQDFLYHCYPTTLRIPGRAVLGLTVWAVYLADRLLDTRTAPPARFHRRYRLPLQAMLAAIVVADFLFALRLRSTVLDKGILVAAGVIAYLYVFPVAGWGPPAWKKPLAALLFAAGTFVVAWTPQLFLPAAAFCALCFANLLSIGSSRGSRRGSRRARWHEWLWIAFVGVCFAEARSSAWFAAIVASAVALYLVSRCRLSGEARRVLADAALLTPLLLRLQ